MSNRTKAVAVAPKNGGEIEVMDQDGVKLCDWGLSPGHNDLKKLAQMFPGADWTPSRGVEIFSPEQGRATQMVHPLVLESGANADWKPRDLSEFEKQMRTQLAEMTKLTKESAQELRQIKRRKRKEEDRQQEEEKRAQQEADQAARDKEAADKKAAEEQAAQE